MPIFCLVLAIFLGVAYLEVANIILTSKSVLTLHDKEKKS